VIFEGEYGDSFNNFPLAFILLVERLLYDFQGFAPGSLQTNLTVFTSQLE